MAALSLAARSSIASMATPTRAPAPGTCPLLPPLPASLRRRIPPYTHAAQGQPGPGGLLGCWQTVGWIPLRMPSVCSRTPPASRCERRWEAWADLPIGQRVGHAQRGIRCGLVIADEAGPITHFPMDSHPPTAHSPSSSLAIPYHAACPHGARTGCHGGESVASKLPRHAHPPCRVVVMESSGGGGDDECQGSAIALLPRSPLTPLGGAGRTVVCSGAHEPGGAGQRGGA